MFPKIMNDENFYRKAVEQAVAPPDPPDDRQHILNGNADLIFVAQPSTAQKQLAEASGVKLVYTPFAREAFVF
ncbi:hypothetical protein MJM83_31945, partial [Salmonella enterica subsp. enterica serovar Montevideo]|nr:hypothetical protein [Salmonella enterica subsp. enterica serovar Montevideo]